MVLKHEVLNDAIIKFQFPEELELNNAHEIKRTVNHLAFENGYKYVIVDLGNTKYIDSTGLGVLVSLHKQALANAGAIAFVNVDTNVRNLLKITALERILNIFDNLGEALNFLKS